MERSKKNKKPRKKCVSLKNEFCTSMSSWVEGAPKRYYASSAVVWTSCVLVLRYCRSRLFLVTCSVTPTCCVSVSKCFWCVAPRSNGRDACAQRKTFFEDEVETAHIVTRRFPNDSWDLSNKHLALLDMVWLCAALQRPEVSRWHDAMGSWEFVSRLYPTSMVV